MAPTVHVSAWPYRLVVVAGVVAFGALLVFGVTLVGVGGLAVVALFALATRKRLAGAGEPALARRGDELVGTALPEPVPVAGTTFAIVDDHEGSWLIELYRGERTIRLSAGAWRVEGEGRVSRRTAPSLLERLGLRPIA